MKSLWNTLFNMFDKSRKTHKRNCVEKIADNDNPEGKAALNAFIEIVN